MRVIPVGAKYESKIKVLDDQKLIIWMDCLCGDFLNRRIKYFGENADRKYYAEPCKHLQKGVDALIKLGYSLKKPKAMEGPDKLLSKTIKKIVERSGGICEVGIGDDRCMEKATRFHRMIRGSNGGKYTFENTKHICKYHHDLIHSNEFKGSKSK